MNDVRLGNFRPGHLPRWSGDDHRDHPMLAAIARRWWQFKMETVAPGAEVAIEQFLAKFIGRDAAQNVAVHGDVDHRRAVRLVAVPHVTGDFLAGEFFDHLLVRW